LTDLNLFLTICPETDLAPKGAISAEDSWPVDLHAAVDAFSAPEDKYEFTFPDKILASLSPPRRPLPEAIAASNLQFSPQSQQN
jgi:hypothetical protein